LITNKPKIGVEEASYRAGTSFTKGGEASFNVEAVYNAPIGENTALRAVVYYDDQGGYIDNVAGTRSARESARFRPGSTVRSNGTIVGTNSGGLDTERAGFQAGATVAATDALLANVNFLELNNNALVEDDFNDTSYFGFRASLLHEFNDDWSLSAGYAHQELDSDGVFFIDPTLGDDLDIQRFADDRLEDDFDNFNWTVKGRVAGLEALYTGAFTNRDIDQLSDYTDYLFVGQYLPYYICDGAVTYPGAGVAPSGTCNEPLALIPTQSGIEVQTHEFRLTTDSDNRFRATAGVFYSDLKLEELVDFTYPSAANSISFDGVSRGFGPETSPPTATLIVPSGVLFPDDTLFRNDITRTDEQFGIFGEGTFDLNDQFALTVGARYYDVAVDLRGAFSSSFGSFGSTTVDDNDIPFTPPPGGSSRSLDVIFDGVNNVDKAETSGVIFKVTGTYTPTDDLLFYGTYSQGFRPGILNRPVGTEGPNNFTVPAAVDTDNVDNFEFGWKTTLADNQLRFNGAAFYVDISDLQTTIFDPSIVNLSNARVLGVEGDITYAPLSIEGLTVNGAFSVLDSEITDVLTPTGDVVSGDPLAFAPSFQGNLRARYEWDIADNLLGHVMPSIVYSSSSNSDVLRFNTDRVAGYTQVGLALGVSGDNWTGEIYANNLLDSSGEISRAFGNDRQRVTPVRPRTIGARVAYNFR